MLGAPERQADLAPFRSLNVSRERRPLTTTAPPSSVRTYRFERILVRGEWRRDWILDVEPTGRIRALGPASDDADGFETVSGWALPGLHNVHSHAFQRGMTGLAERGGKNSFWRWREVMYAFLGILSPEDVEAIAAQLYVELLRGGFTCVGEFHYLHHGPGGKPYDDPAELSRRIVAASRAADIGLVHIPVVYLTSGFGGAALAPEQERFRLDAEGVGSLVAALAPEARGTGPGGRVSLGWGVHSLRACPPGEWAEAVRVFSADEGRPVHIHLSEQPKEVAESRAELGAPPIRWTLDHADVDGRWCLIHCTHASQDEVAAMARTGAVVGLCPATEANLGDGLFPLETWLGAGGGYGIGTDSHVSTGAAAELRTLEYGQRLSTGTRGVVSPAPPFSGEAGTGSALVGRALAGGARALGRGVGDFEVGQPADVVVLDPHHPSLVARDEATVLDAWVFADHGNPVRDVMVGGRWAVQAGRHQREEEILTRFRRVMGALAERL